MMLNLTRIMTSIDLRASNVSLFKAIDQYNKIGMYLLFNRINIILIKFFNSLQHLSFCVILPFNLILMHTKIDDPYMFIEASSA